MFSHSFHFLFFTLWVQLLFAQNSHSVRTSVYTIKFHRQTNESKYTKIETDKSTYIQAAK